MDGLDPLSDTGTVGVSIPGAAPTTPEGSSSHAASDSHDEIDPLLDLLERWEEQYRRGEDLTPESLGVTDPALIGALRELIRKQKRLYARLNLANVPADESAGADEPLPSFPDHEILSEIGRGGMGVVYKARDLQLDRVVALKTITEFRTATPEQLDRFLDEARAAARLRHPNIITIHAIGVHQGRPYFSLEFADTGDLKHQLAAKPMAPRQAAELVETLAKAVHVAHLAGIVHRDSKPSNILLSAEGVPKIADFGLAKLLDADSARTLSGQVLGTPSYMAPEQAEGHSKQVGPAVDIYALGAILYHALTGRPPFLGESQLETLKHVTSTEVVSPHLLRPDVPRDLETICLKCLDKDPHKRYASANDLAEDLRRFLEDRPIRARPAGPAGRLRRWSRRNPGVAGLSATVVATLVVGIVVSTILTIRATRAERGARSEAQISKAVNEFLNKDLLAQASAYSQASLVTRPDPDLKVRTVLDRASARIADRFASQPLVEASIRQTVGETYHQLGLYAQRGPIWSVRSSCAGASWGPKLRRRSRPCRAWAFCSWTTASYWKPNSSWSRRWRDFAGRGVRAIPIRSPR